MFWDGVGCGGGFVCWCVGLMRGRVKVWWNVEYGSTERFSDEVDSGGV